MENVIPAEKAKEEIGSWLDYKRVSTKKRESYKDAIENLCDAIAAGYLSLAEDKTLHQKLIFPIEDQDGNPHITKLVYKPRISVGDLQGFTKKTTTGDDRINAIAAALTDQAAGVIAKLDTEDNSIAQAIAVFFV